MLHAKQEEEDSYRPTFDQGAVRKVARLVHRYRLMEENEAELEARLGKLDPQTGAFVAGVHCDTLKDIESMLKSNPNIAGGSEWVEHHDYYYKHNDRSTRTRVEFDPKTLTHRSSTVHKQTVASVIVPAHQTFVPVSSETAHTIECHPQSNANQMAVRISLSLEKTVVDPPALVKKTDLVRITRRRTFTWDRRGRSHRPCWQYDLSKVWTAPTRSGAEVAQVTTPSLCEVEIETLPPAVLEHSDAYVAHSLIMKAFDFAVKYR